jgi:type II secretory pathway pseudopilin PulG
LPLEHVTVEASVTVDHANTHRPVTVVAAVAALLVASVARPPTAEAAVWTAINTVAPSGLAASTETWEATPVDYDRDGDQDVWIGYHDQGGKLWRNNGTGVYTLAYTWPRRNAENRVPDRHDCDWADVDLNGLPDAYCATGRSGANLVKTGQDNELWLQTSRGQFTDVGTAWGVGDVCGRSHYVAFLDANDDPFPDLFVGNATPRDVADPCDNPANGLPDEEMKLYLNQSGAGFRQVRGFGITGFGGVRFAEVADVNRDTWDDLLVSYSGGTLLYRNNGGTGFTNVSAANGLTANHADAVFGDLDRDGDPDLVTALPGRVEYRLNNGSRFLAPVRAYAVPSGGGARAVSVGDADDDGDLDIYALISNPQAGTNPRDVVLRNTNLQFTAVQVPAATGVGDAVAALDGNSDGRAEFLVLNGVEVSGPIQRIELRFQ